MANIVKRITKGVPLTFSEIDSNFENINTELVLNTNNLETKASVDDLGVLSDALDNVQVQLASNSAAAGIGITSIVGLLATTVQAALSELNTLKISRENAWPIGSVYINASDNTNPGTLLGVGTWQVFGTGRTMVGIDTSNGIMDTIGETFGLANTTLPIHTHGMSGTGNIVNGTITAGGVTTQGSVGGSTIKTPSPSGAFQTASGNITLTGAVAGRTILNETLSGTYYTGFSINGGAHSHTIFDAGSNPTNTNYQPSIVVYMWRRVS